MPVVSPEDKFDSSLGMYVAETWWELGKLLARRNDRKALDAWAEQVRKKLTDREAPAVSGASLQAFATTAFALLKAKHQGQKIASDFLKLVRKSAHFEVEEDGQYLEPIELPDTFWANEYRFLLIDLCKPKSGGVGWLTAASTCPSCKEFFIKGRSDQKFHDDRCKAKFHNKNAYDQEKAARQKRTRRGKLIRPKGNM